MAEFDRIVEALYNKIVYNTGNVDDILTEQGLETFKKLLGTSSTGSIYVIETGVNSETNQWYRLYSDGWCEQGGTVNSDPTSTFTVAFLKDYNDINYTISLTHLKNDTAAQFRWSEVSVKSKSGFTFVTPYGQTGATGLGQVMWVTYGFISTEN